MSTACRAALHIDGSGTSVKMGPQRHRVLRHSSSVRPTQPLMRVGLGSSIAPAIADVSTEWNNGDLDSYLVEITAEVLRQTDAKTGKPLKSTGRGPPSRKAPAVGPSSAR